MDEMLFSAQSGPLRKGRKHLINHLKGARLTQRQAIQAKCYDCDGMGETGKCDLKHCPLYPYNPYGVA